MTSRYSDIASQFLGKVTSYDFLNIDENTYYEIVKEYIHTAVARPYIRVMFSELKCDDDIDTVTWELKNPYGDDSDKYFVEDVFAQALVVAWLEPQVKNQALIKQFVGTSKERWFSQQQHLSQLQALLETTQINLRRMISDDGYIKNDYLDS